MDNFVYNAFNGYFQVLEKVGYMKQKNIDSLLVLNFLYELIYHDYRGYIKEEDYHTIEKALNCLYGTNCLIPYPDYLKMGKLKLGEMTEVLSRVKTAEEELKVQDLRIKDNDILIEDNIRRIDEYGTRLDDHDDHLSRCDEEIADHETRLSSAETTIAAHSNTLENHESRLQAAEATIAEHTETLEDHETRITAIEDTKVIKGKNHIQNIPDIDLSQYDVIDD